MNIIQENPYRQLGVFANSPTKERVANHNRLKAFLKVGKQVEFSLDLSQYLPPINRTPESVADAEAKLTLPNEQLKYAQFWFLKETPLDDIAFNHLFAGDMVAAVEIWEKKECLSSLQNKVVCALLKKDYASALNCAEQLYNQYSQAFVSAIVDNENSTTADALALNFINTLNDEIGFDTLLPYITNDNWKTHLQAKAVKPLIEKIQSEIDTAKAINRKDALNRLKAGEKLKSNTKNLLSQLKNLLQITDLQYQMIADKLGLEILQCGIDYYNGSTPIDAAHKAMELQFYAMSIVVGKMAKDRCNENVEILQNIIKKLPPQNVFEEDKYIQCELNKYIRKAKRWKSFSGLSLSFMDFEPAIDDLEDSLAVLQSTEPILDSIKDKVGTSTYYWETSEQVINSVLSNVIEYVNIVNNSDMQVGLILDRERTLRKFRAIIKNAMLIMRELKQFDMRSEFQTKRFNPNMKALSDLYNQLGLRQTTWNTRTTTSQSSSSSSSNSGCMLWIVVGILSLLIMSFI